MSQTQALRVVVDQNITLPADAAQQLQLTVLAGRDIRAHHVEGADALLVRSVTRVNRELLSNSAVRFVGTATSGTDHLDLDWLSSAGIAVADAAGANAGAVTDYVVSCLAALLQKQGLGGSPATALTQMTVAVVGVGRVGSQLIRRLQALGVQCVGCDPLQQIVVGLRYVSLTEALQADVVCLHTPLTEHGPHATRYLLDAARLAALPAHTVLINAGRGGVIDNVALAAHLQRCPEQKVVLDVWENEPRPAPDLVSRVWLATPHIAGYSQESKQLAGTQILQALYRHFGLPTAASTDIVAGAQNADSYMPPEWCQPAEREGEGEGEEKKAPAPVLEMIQRCFSVAALSERFKRDYLAAQDQQQAAGIFDAYRREQLTRREFSAVSEEMFVDLDDARKRLLRAAGFTAAR